MRQGRGHEANALPGAMRVRVRARRASRGTAVCRPQVAEAEAQGACLASHRLLRHPAEALLRRRMLLLRRRVQRRELFMQCFDA